MKTSFGLLVVNTVSSAVSPVVFLTLVGGIRAEVSSLQPKGQSCFSTGSSSCLALAFFFLDNSFQNLLLCEYLFYLKASPLLL